MEVILKKTRILILCTTIFSIIFASCASTPKAEETPKVDEIVKEADDAKESAVEQIAETVTMEQIELARQSAVEAGAEKNAPEQFAAAEAIYNLLKASSEEDAKNSLAYADLQKRYLALAEYSSAVSSKNRIDELSFSSFDKKSYDDGCAALESFSELSKATDVLGAAMLEKASLASSQFKNVLHAGFKVKAKESRSNAFVAKKNADSVKAGVAAKEGYAKAVQEFRSGDSSYSMQNPEAACNHYEESEKMFESIFKDVSAKREAASKAMEEAKAKVAESQNYALTADSELPLADENVQGIEAEDAKLLEDDNYSAPEDAVANISEEISEDSSQEAGE